MSTVDPAALATAATALLDSVVEQIEQHRDDLVEQFSSAVATALPRVCQSVSRSGEACDRAPAHTGLCSWQFDEVARTYRGYEEAAARVPNLEADLLAARQQIRTLQNQLAPERAKSAAQV